MTPVPTLLATTRMMLLAAAVGFAWSCPAFPHAGGGGGGGGSSGASGGASGGSSNPGQASHNASQPCPQGFVRARDTCVRQRADLLPEGTPQDAELYAQGRALALAGDYRQALVVLDAVRRTDDPMVYTMRGYALRKLGWFAEAMALYAKALAIDPGNVNTHEYIGEGYVTTGRIDLARVELAKVEQGCAGTACEQYEDLARAIQTGEVE